jgi:putative aldouronate transport system permease protein
MNYDKISWSEILIKDFKRNKYKYLMIVPVLAYFIVFAYFPMYGVVIAFKQYRITLSIADSPWIGFNNFIRFFNDVYFSRIIRNTFILAFYSLFWEFPTPILFALMLNELRSRIFKKTVQTITYFPHFISVVIVAGLIRNYSLTTGLFNTIRDFLGLEIKSLLQEPSYFRSLYIGSNIWQSLGWNSIIFLAALSAIDVQLYEAAYIDGASRLRRIWHVTLPGILPTILILLILRLGMVLNVDFERVLLLYTPTTYEVADVISTYVYRLGLIGGDFSYSTAVGLFNSLINLFFLMAANFLSKKASGGLGLF